MKTFTYLLITVLVLLTTACGRQETAKEKLDPREYKEPLMEANKRVVKTESQHIEDFLRRYKWEMEESGSGLFYMIYFEGDGQQARSGLLASISYEIKAITGDVIYSSEKDGPLSFIIGNGEVISGLEEGILLMKVNDKAKFIIPSHLAYGLVGDGDLIPAKTTLIYDIELLSLTESN